MANKKKRDTKKQAGRFCAELRAIRADVEQYRDDLVRATAIGADTQALSKILPLGVCLKQRLADLWACEFGMSELCEGELPFSGTWFRVQVLERIERYAWLYIRQSPVNSMDASLDRLLGDVGKLSAVAVALVDAEAAVKTACPG